MKNIHVLQKNIFNQLGVDHYGKTPTQIKIAEFLINKNIYITSNEEIKEGEWFYSPKLVDAQKFLDRRDWRKIILTTDQALIKDGVQAIDDEFLEWFVNNPSCERVEVESNKCLVKRGQCSCSYQDIDCQCSGYQIIIPQEKICSFCDGTGQVVSSTTISRFKTCDCKMIPQKELKQENDYTALLKPVGTKQDSLIEKMKPLQEQWQKDMDKSLQQQDKNKYNEEDMEKAFRVGFNVGYNDEESPSYLTFEEWIKEYKKK